ncbi:hypothetical protein LJC23_07000, partial [Desulfovibrio sp. OttesenSCG-928-I05]|nr:hypothetical protein [Desulfovibrio sp. OttesenSCG-928-I05]
TLIKGRTTPAPVGETPERGHDLGSPRVMHGMVSLAVDAAPPKLTARIETDRPEYRPGGTVKATVFVADTEGKAGRAQVTLLAVDERILRAAGEANRYYPGVTFGEMLSYGVINADTRMRLLNISAPLMKGDSMNMMRMASPMAAPAQESADMEMAAGGGEGESEELRQNFSPLAFWLGEGESDENGTLAASFTLPDTLTSYRLVAVVTDTRNGFATAEHSVTATKPLQLLSALPRFLTEGDAPEARILVQNMSGTRAQVRVEAEGTGVTLEETRREITLAAGESGRVAFPLRTGMAGTAVLTLRGSMTVDGVTETDALRIIIPVLTRVPMTTVAAAGLLEEGASYALPVQTPFPLDPRSSLNVQMAASPAAGLSLVADELLLYPWHCLEQRLSRAWVRILRMQYGDLLGLDPVNDDAQIVAETLASVAKFQNRDGGFSIWPGLGRSSYYLTAYALLVNREAESLANAGGMTLSLPARVKKDAYAWLADALESSVKAGGSEDAMPLAADAMAVWVLAANDPARAASLLPHVLQRAEKAGKANPMTWGALLMASQAVNGQKKDSGRIITLLEKSAAITPTQMHFASADEYGMWMTMGSTLRDNGMVLGALAAVKAEYPRLEALAHWVSQGLGEKKTLSTQEAIFGMWGLSSYLRTLGGNRPVSIEAVWNDSASVTRSFTRLVEPAQSWTLDAQTIENAGESTLTLNALQGRPYWTARLRYGSPSLPVRAENAGFTITRSWLTPGPWKMGDTVDVRVTLTVPATRRHVLLFDPFPAGLEPLYASRVDLADRDTRYQHPWQFQESRDDGMLLYAESVEPGVYTYTYTLRAAAPGHFMQRPSIVEEMYTPEVFGRTTGDEVSIMP